MIPEKIGEGGGLSEIGRGRGLALKLWIKPPVMTINHLRAWWRFSPDQLFSSASLRFQFFLETFQINFFAIFTTPPQIINGWPLCCYVVLVQWVINSVPYWQYPDRTLGNISPTKGQKYNRTQMSWPGRPDSEVWDGTSWPGLCILSQTSWPGHLFPIVLLPLRIPQYVVPT